MTDLRLTPEGDLELVEGDLALDPGLGTSVLVSLFSDARVDLTDSPDGTVRGWWAESGAGEFGSRLWTIAREKRIDAALPRIEAIAEDALRWMIDAGLATSVEASAAFTGPEAVTITVRIARGPAARWAHLWQGVEAQRLRQGPFTIQTILEDAR